MKKTIKQIINALRIALLIWGTLMSGLAVLTLIDISYPFSSWTGWYTDYNINIYPIVMQALVSYLGAYYLKKEYLS